MTNKPMLSVELRDLLERVVAHDFAEYCQECGIGQSETWKELRALLDADKVNSREMGLMQYVDAHPIKSAKTDLVECDACPTSGGCVSVCMKAPKPATQRQGEPVELSTEELRFLEAVSLNPGSKLNGGIACGEEGNSLWPRLEALGLIECLGSYKWQLTFSAFEMGVKAFLGMRPAPVAVVMPARKPQRITDEYARGWNDYDAEYKRLNGVKL